MSQSVTIKNGSWRGHDVQGTYKVISPFKESPSGNFITVELVDFAGYADGTRARVKCRYQDLSFIGKDDAFEASNISEPRAVSIEQEVRDTESEAEAEQRIARSFEVFNTMTKAAVKGKVRGMIVSGPPGIGKSFEVIEELTKVEATKRRAPGQPESWHLVKGMVTPICLYMLLHKYRKKGEVTVIDDCDVIFYDDVSLNILKAALDSSKKRRICWNSNSRILEDNDVPNDFDFEGSIIFLTNTDFDNVRSKTLAAHLAALKSRCHYLDLTISNQKDILRRIRALAKGALFRDYNLTPSQRLQIVDFVETNASDLDGLNLRTVLKIADLVVAADTGADWKEMAVHTVMRPEAKWRYLAAQRKAAKTHAVASGTVIEMPLRA